MKPFVRATVIFTLGFVLAVVVSAAEDSNAEASSPKGSDNEEETIKVYKRLIPADVLRGNVVYSFISIISLIYLISLLGNHSFTLFQSHKSNRNELLNRKISFFSTPCHLS